MDMEQKKIRYLEKIKQLRLMDDTFFNSCFDGNIPCMEVVLRAVLGNDRLRVTEVITQQSVPNLYGRAVRFDALATDGETIYDVEIQRSDEGANPRRARFNSSMIDSREVSKGTLFPDLPETYVIFITEHDVWKRGKPLYTVRRTFEDTDEVFNDGTHILYVNGECQSESPLGRLMHDFFCSDPNDMYSDVLAERVRFFKEDEKGVAAMCNVMKEIYDDGFASGEAQGEVRGEVRGEIRGAETERIKSIKNLISSLGITAEAAMDALKIAKTDQPKYLALL
ncbi:Rpn family recombination-promoting nuclease/putative transposase [Selenomonas sp. oral taxon 478]|uniref:Rpn family recombination-promoting nuclease/putative transposase n=1 Tax=Selenomonas sp. oral taxon 478 TaxID=712538 RepID=UPI000B188B85|nr:Rpn family recombination-promoting nuclease/putative transposase [Selenomonas sp. oral taxon 478]